MSKDNYVVLFKDDKLQALNGILYPSKIVNGKTSQMNLHILQKLNDDIIDLLETNNILKRGDSNVLCMMSHVRGNFINL